MPRLNQSANRIAHHLRETTGIRPDDPVALLIRQPVTSIVAMLAVLKAGGAYVPVDPDSPPALTAQILDHIAPKAVLLESSQAAKATFFDGEIFVVDVMTAVLDTSQPIPARWPGPDTWPTSCTPRGRPAAQGRRRRAPGHHQHRRLAQQLLRVRAGRRVPVGVAAHLRQLGRRYLLHARRRGSGATRRPRPGDGPPVPGGPDRPRRDHQHHHDARLVPAPGRRPGHVPPRRHCAR